MRIFVVKIDWATESGHDVKLYPYNDYYNAYDKFKDLIREQHNPVTQLIDDLKFDEDGEPVGDYELHFEDNNSCESELWWQLVDNWNSYYIYIELLDLEVM